MNHPKHILITRMNVEWNISRPVEERNDPSFLSHRFEIFEKTCYPSVNSQTNKNFIWFMLLDAQAPNEFRQRVEHYSSNPRIIPIYIKNKDTLLETVRTEINARLVDSTTHLITTNLDSDDSVSKNFIESVQNQFQNQDFEFINFPFGYMYRFIDETLYLRDWLTAPCHTLIEKRENFETAIKYEHSEITQYNTRQVITKPIWLMTVHGKNVRTSFDVNAAWQPSHRLLGDFDIRFNPPQKSYLETLNDTLSAVVQVMRSERKWDNPAIKFKKIANILSPAIVRSLRRVQMVLQSKPTAPTR